MTIPNLWNMFQDIRREVPRVRKKYGEPEEDDPRHWPRILAREIGQATEIEVDHDDPDLLHIAITAAAITWCWIGQLTEPKEKPELRDDPRWHIAPDIPAKLEPLCGKTIFLGMSILRRSEYLQQPDRAFLYNAPVCTGCRETLELAELPEGKDG